MHQKKSKDSTDLIRIHLLDDNSTKPHLVEEPTIENDENTQPLPDTNNEEDFTSNGLSDEDDEDLDDEDENMSSDSFEGGNVLQPINQSVQQHHLNNLLNTNPNINITYIHTENIMEITQMTNDHIIAQTMAVLAAKHRHEKPTNIPPSESRILSFVGPCPLYSLASSFGLDMHHGLSNFPCRDVLANGEGHHPAPPLWQHLTSSHNLNLYSSSLLITDLLLHGYSSPGRILFSSTSAQPILRTTPRYSLIKRCPLTKYGVYGIQYKHGTRLCSGYTCNTNIYLHLISFHKMTHDASLRLSRAIAFHDKQFIFNSDEILVSEFCKSPRFLNNPCRLLKKISKKKPVKIT
ncbi:unnamed protein product [Adineta ricciae]|uniref:Uncharacterized protein n=1 Tax=Adineta ricciae TaxID=249248 RepID=A0A815S7F4_ADIRI|nr:unnamed protein product [Adineta ricciae]CAF1484438.1 unnamed protein product [Adineta ricciae]